MSGFGVERARVRGARRPGDQGPEAARRPASRRNRAASGQAEAKWMRMCAAFGTIGRGREGAAEEIDQRRRHARHLKPRGARSPDGSWSGCEHRARPLSGAWPTASLKRGSVAQGVAVVGTIDHERQMAVWAQISDQGCRPSAWQVKRDADRGTGSGNRQPLAPPPSTARPAPPAAKRILPGQQTEARGRKVHRRLQPNGKRCPLRQARLR